MPLSSQMRANHVRVWMLFSTSFLLTACGSLRTQQLTGTDFVNRSKNGRAYTSVTPEEYDRMTEAERQRLNAQTGAEVIWTSEKTKKDVSDEALEKVRDAYHRK